MLYFKAWGKGCRWKLILSLARHEPPKPAVRSFDRLLQSELTLKFVVGGGAGE